MEITKVVQPNFLVRQFFKENIPETKQQKPRDNYIYSNTNKILLLVIQKIACIVEKVVDFTRCSSGCLEQFAEDYADQECSDCKQNNLDKRKTSFVLSQSI